MAKVDLMGLAPDAFPRVRGQFLVRLQRGQYIAVAWPPKRGDRQHPNSKWTAQQWAYAARWASRPNPLDFQTAIYMTKGTDWVPRDILMRAIYGKAYEVYDTNGVLWTVNPHSPPKARRPMVQQWQPNFWDLATTTSSTVHAFAWKGNILGVDQPTEIGAAQAYFTGVSGGLYRMALARLSPGNTIAEITFSDQVQDTYADRRWREFNLTASMDPGERYWLAFGRQDAAANYNIPCWIAQAPKWLMPANNFGLGMLAQTTPAVGHILNAPNLFSPVLSMLASY
jgi:hypothetical protein